MNMKNKEDIGYLAVILVGSGDRARQTLREKLKRLDTLLLNCPFDFQGIRVAGEEVIQAVAHLQSAYAILEKANSS